MFFSIIIDFYRLYLYISIKIKLKLRNIQLFLIFLKSQESLDIYVDFIIMHEI